MAEVEQIENKENKYQKLDISEQHNIRISEPKKSSIKRMENEGSDDGLEEEDLEEGEIPDSDGEDENDEKSGNAQQPNGISGQTGVLQLSVLGNSTKRKIADVRDQDGSEGVLKKSKAAPQYVDHDQVLAEDDWASGVSFPLKKRSKFEECLEDVKWQMIASLKRKEGHNTSDGSPNEDGDRRSESPSCLKAKKKSRKLGSLCRIKVKKSGDKATKKRKPESKSRLLRQKRDIKHNRPVCKFFMDGKCAKGADCPFFHPPPHPRIKELCKFYLSGHCAKGKHCHFMHEEFPCKFYHTGAVCYSKESCRFSHKPLTEEMKILLDKHLHGSSSRQDDDDMDDDYYHERERERSRSHERPEPKAKRPCLLGSPPRHIREAAETKQWQEEMKKLQHQSKVSAFEIQVSPIREVPSPGRFSRPNFYTDTLSHSPRRRIPSGDVSDSIPSSKSYDVLNHSYPDMSSEDCDNDWTSICDMVNKISPSRNDISASEKVVNCDQELIQIKSEERSTPEISDVEHGEEFEKSPSPVMVPQDFHSSESQSSPKHDNGKAESPKNRSPVHIPDLCPSPEVVLPPINIPSHLPRKQRELFMRIHHNQKNVPSGQSSMSKVIGDTSDKSEFDKTENESSEPTIKLEDSFYSSEDDDDDDIDQPLTNVLRKLDEKPCPKEKESAPAINIIQMIKSIGQKASEKPQTSAYHETEAFWQNILSSSASVSTPAVVTAPTVNQSIIESTPQSPKEPGTPDICQDVKKIIPEAKPSIPRDPRLQSREQRKPVTREFSSFPSPPTVSTEEITSTFTPLVDPKIGNQFPNKLRDIGTMLQNPTPAVVVEGLQGLGSIPYKLHEVAASPPNYLSYIYASNYDTKLLSDPRLRKHIAQGSSTVHQLTMQSKGVTLPNIPPPPLAVLNTLNSDIVNSGASDDSMSESVLPASEPMKSERKTHIIPRTRKIDPSGDSRHMLPGTMHATMPDIISARPPPHPVVPSPASHLPRAIADPRLAKLHHPLDPRRPRSMAERNSQRMSERKPAAVIPPKNTPSVEEKSNPNKGAGENAFPADSAIKAELDGKNKRDMQEGGGSKKLDVCKNRKSSMSYSSPLNSCEDSVSSTTSGYNSYNQRPKRRMPNVPPPVSETCTPVIDSTPKSPDFCDPSHRGNENPEVSTSLKEIFKTIDPAASPFC